MAKGTRVYHAGKDVDDLLKEASLLFFSENGLSPTVFPLLRKFETEIVAMAASLLNGGENNAGTVTSGGTESLLMALKTARDWAQESSRDQTARDDFADYGASCV